MKNLLPSIKFITINANEPSKDEQKDSRWLVQCITYLINNQMQALIDTGAAVSLISLQICPMFVIPIDAVKRRAVKHSGAVLTYAPTYRPKDGICAGYIDSSIKFCRSPFASRFTKAAARPADDVSPQSATQRTTYRVPIKPASHFYGGWVRWISLWTSITRIHAPLQACFNMSAKVCWILSLRFTFVTYVFGIDPSGVLEQWALPR